MKLKEVSVQRTLYHLGANIPTSSLYPLTFFTDGEGSAQSYAEYASYDNPKLHKVINNIINPAHERDVAAAAKEVGAYKEGTEIVDYLTMNYFGKDAIKIANYLQTKGFDGAILKDLAANQRTPIMAYIPFKRPTPV